MLAEPRIPGAGDGTRKGTELRLVDYAYDGTRHERRQGA